MAINKQHVSVPLLKGLNTVVDPQQEQIGSLTVLKNAKFTKIGSISKRSGFQTIASSGTLVRKQPGLWNNEFSHSTTMELQVGINQALSVRGSGENLVVTSKDSIFKYSKAVKLLYRTGTYTPLSFSSFDVPTDDAEQFNPQVLVYGDWVYML